MNKLYILIGATLFFMSCEKESEPLEFETVSIQINDFEQKSNP